VNGIEALIIGRGLALSSAPDETSNGSLVVRSSFDRGWSIRGFLPALFAFSPQLIKVSGPRARALGQRETVSTHEPFELLLRRQHTVRIKHEVERLDDRHAALTYRHRSRAQASETAGLIPRAGHALDLSDGRHTNDEAAHPPPSQHHATAGLVISTGGQGSRVEQSGHITQCECDTRFSDDRAELSPAEIIRRLRAQSWATAELVAATTVEKGRGRPRSDGTWVWAYVGFVCSGLVDVEPWWRNSDEAVWREAGFAECMINGRATRRPSYQNTQRRFAELEEFDDALRAAAGRLIRRAVERCPEVAHHVHVDSTEAETHAALVHDCPVHEPCMRYSPARRAEVARRPQRASTDQARETRQRKAELPTDEELAAEHDDGRWDELSEASDGRVRLRSAKHWYRTLDGTAGLRAYTREGKLIRFWHGYYVQQAVSHLVGAPLAVTIASASRNEKDIYLETTFPQLAENTGTVPQTMIADRGFAWAQVYEHNTRHRVASVMPFRKRNGVDRPHDEETHDRHGVPRCQHCGGTTRFIRDVAAPYPRIWFRCESALGVPRIPECVKDQSIACSKDWRVLTRLWQTDERYQELRASHSMYERIHSMWRKRWRVGGADVSSRPKRIGIACQNLRAQTALLIEWLLVCEREGWLTGRAQRRHQRERTSLRDRTAQYLGRLNTERRDDDLDHPYGPAAVRLRIKGASITPPSRRRQQADEREQRRREQRALARSKPSAPPPSKC